jgi:hypothetical protein
MVFDFHPGASGLDPIGVFAAGSVPRFISFVSFVGFLFFFTFLFSRLPLQLWCISQDMAWRFAEWEGCDLVSLFSHFHIHFYRSFY